jgi:hypothetical protein
MRERLRQARLSREKDDKRDGDDDDAMGGVMCGK